LEENYLFYSSLTLLGMGCLALALSILFRLKSHAVNSLPKNLSANVFNKTFVVFNPYSEHRRTIPSLAFLAMILVFIVCVGFSLIIWRVFESGFMLSFFIVIICLNLIAVEGAYEVYENSRTFINAVRGGTDFGLGDIKAFQIVRSALPKIAKYYIGLAILFMIFSVALPYIWSSVLWFLARPVGLMLEVGASTGAVNYQIAVFLFALVLVLIQILISRIKGKLLNYVIESPTS